MTNEHLEVLRAVITLSQSIAELTRAVRSLPWDSLTPLVTLTSADASSVLQRYLDGEITISDVEKWANLIEGREDIGFESASVETLMELVNELANPVTMGALTSQCVQRWLHRLRP